MAVPAVPRGSSASYFAAGTQSFLAGFLGASGGSQGSAATIAGSAGSAGSAALIAGSGAKPFTSELDGEYTCEEVVFEITDRIIARIYGYKPDPNAPAPQAFVGNADRPLEGINLAATGSGAGGPTSPAGEINTKIFQAAMAAYNEQMSSASGPGGGKVACAWAVNKVMARAGLKPIGSNTNLVDSLEQDLAGGRGQRIEPRTAGQPGDIVIMGKGGRAHVGIVIGPDKVVSNSSSKAKFTWVAGYATYDRWYDPSNPCRVYRVVR